MANFKNITDLPIAESAEGLNLIVNDNGSAKQIAADKIGGGEKLSDFENDLFYKKKELFLELTEKDFVEWEHPNGDFTPWVYTASPKLDWLTSTNAIEYEASGVDAISGEHFSFSSADGVWFERIPTTDGDAAVLYYSDWFEIGSGYDYFTSPVEEQGTFRNLVKDEFTIALFFKVSDFNLKIYRVSEKKIPAKFVEPTGWDIVLAVDGDFNTRLIKGNYDVFVEKWRNGDVPSAVVIQVESLENPFGTDTYPTVNLFPVVSLDFGPDGIAFVYDRDQGDYICLYPDNMTEKGMFD